MTQAEIDYTTKAFQAVGDLSLWPTYLRRVANYFLPSCKIARESAQTFRDIIEPEIERRAKEKQEYLAKSAPVPEYDDAIAWFQAIAKGRRYEPVTAQIALSVGSIHSSGDILLQTLYFIAQDQAIIEPLRDEIEEVLRNDGWKKTALTKLRLVDSVLKETQRVKPVVMRK
jgi:hypothetical protein